ncbi:C-terminal binding protein [Curtobacterium sp. VKM Ac-2887]|uniref:C-terminal binding protein n=1 Tax=Curtobacterium sp. VKM Ac-2887 TaxID=2783819 RepID=UPI00188DA87F|nr:C-terminal binding protein [Curtobacterium sp. VKM Ac-2887]MBF4585681.1 C-terminal binding protein [Curtobacterium sp. VKM Ac-2887]
MKVVLTNPTMRLDPKVGGELLDLADVVNAPDSTPEGILSVAHDADALIVGVENVRAPLIQQLERARVIHRMGIGVDFIDIDAATSSGIQVTNVPDANHREVATHAVAMILALTRLLKPWDAGVRAGTPVDFRRGMTLHRPDQQRAGILGLGRIGAHVARVLRASGYDVVGYDPFVDAAAAEERGVRWLPIDEVIATSDVLSVHVPLTHENRHLIDAAAIATMPTGAVLVNVSRGGLVDEEALADALASGHLSGAGIDTFETEPLPVTSRLTTFDNVFLSPHAAHFSSESIGEIYAKSMDEVVRVLRGEQPRYPVNHL